MTEFFTPSACEETHGHLTKPRACADCDRVHLCRANQDIHDACELISLRGDLFEAPAPRRSRWTYRRTHKRKGKLVTETRRPQGTCGLGQV